MPELPEVETVVKSLKKYEGSIIELATSPNKYQKVLENISLDKLNKEIKNKKILRISRRGKYILFKIEDNLITIHLRMTGRLMPSINEDEKKYVSFCFSLNKNRKIFFKDVRKFGKIGFYKDSNYLENKLGLEPLSKDLNFKSLKEILTNKKRIIKALLLDQKYIAGLGNIYVDEALWYARINPKEISNKITDKQIKDLCTGIKKILKKSIDNNGTSFISFKYAEDKEGNFAEKLSVFNRKDKPCKRCKTKIKKTVVSQRGTHFCKECQKFN